MKNNASDHFVIGGLGWDSEPIQQMLKFDFVSLTILVLLLIYLIFSMIQRSYKKRLDSK